MHVLIVHACISISLSNMYVTSAHIMYINRHPCHECLRCFNACPPIVHVYIATSPLIVHACMSVSLSNMYITRGLSMYQDVHPYHDACFRYLNACPPIVYAFIATSPFIKHADA
jgi:polyferredoxin